MSASLTQILLQEIYLCISMYRYICVELPVPGRSVAFVMYVGTLYSVHVPTVS